MVVGQKSIDSEVYSDDDLLAQAQEVIKYFEHIDRIEVGSYNRRPAIYINGTGIDNFPSTLIKSISLTQHATFMNLIKMSLWN